MWCGSHYIKHFVNEVPWHPGVEQVSHRGHKDAPWLLPVKWLFQALRVQRDLREAVWVTVFEPPRYALGIAVQSTAWRDFRATSDGIPCFIGPLDLARHSYHPLSV